MTGMFLSVSRVLPHVYPLDGELDDYIAAEHAVGRLLDLGVILPRLTELYRWSAGELGILQVTDLVSGATPAYAWDPDDRRPWAPQPKRIVRAVRRALPPPPRTPGSTSPGSRFRFRPLRADDHYGVAVEFPEPITLDLDEAEAEIRQRWFVWTAAGLTVHPVTRIDQNDARPPPVGRSDVTTPRSIRLRVSRPTAHVDIVLHADGWTEVAVLRPEADAVVHATAELESVAAFGELVDRTIELITWSGVPKGHGPAGSAPLPERAARWVLGYDGEGWSNES
jgi:hypothetical protein